MSDLIVNIVYRDFAEDEAPVIKFPELGAEFRWSRAPLAEADVRVYNNSYSYDARCERRVGEKLRMLYLSEPVVVQPVQYDRRTWKKFDYILTWCDPLWRSGGKFIQISLGMYDSPFKGTMNGIRPMSDPSLLTAPRKKAICAIYSDKRSLIPCELYSLRREFPAWFHQHGIVPLDLYGRDPIDVPNYRGRIETKESVLPHYRYGLVLQNTYHPMWSAGYYSDELADTFACMTLPVYFGCYNIEDYVPLDCIVDYRQFASMKELDSFLNDMSEDEFRGYLERIDRFLRESDFWGRHSCHRLYKTIVETAKDTLEGRIDLDAVRAKPLPKDFLQAAESFRERLAFVVSAFLLRHRWLIARGVKTMRFCERLLRSLRKRRRDV